MSFSKEVVQFTFLTALVITDIWGVNQQMTDLCPSQLSHFK